MAGRFVFLIILLALVPAGVIWLQVYLSKQENKWLGLILPICSFMLSLLTVLGMAVYTHNTGFATTYEMIDGQWVLVEQYEPAPETPIMERIPGAIGGVIYTFLLTNIPTAILLVIYKAVRNKQNRRREIEKMSVQDL